MFDRFVGQRSEKRGKSRALMFGVSTVAHTALLATLLVWSFWKVEKLAARRVPVTFVSAAAAPPPPPPPPAPPPPARVTAKPKVVVKIELVQPVRDPDPDPEPAPDPGPSATGPTDPTATGPGLPGGVPGGLGDGRCGEPGQPECPPPAVVEKPKVVPLQAVEAARIAGNADIPLPPEVKQAVVAEGKREVLAMAKLCLDRDGAPTEVSIRKSSGHPAADARIREEMLRWRYRPYRVNGEAVAVCTSILFRYQIQ
jgi:protein TonB